MPIARDPDAPPAPNPSAPLSLGAPCRAGSRSDSFYEPLLAALNRGERFALGTVVHTSGSTPQKTGARAIFFPNGRVLGTLGGGCLEAEARRRALLSLQRGAPFHFTMHLDQDFGWDDGLICGGSATVLIEPDPRRHRPAVAGLVESIGAGKRATLATVIGMEGLSPGTTLLFRPDEAPVGDLVPEPSRQAIEERAQAFLREPWQEPKAVAVGAGRVYFEPHYPLPDLFIIGGGHVGAALAHCAARLDFRISVLDDRASLLSEERFPSGAERIVEEIPAGVRKREIHPDTYVVIVTRGHQHDAEALREVIGSPAAYLGMIGSRRKVHVIFQGLLSEGLATPEQLRRVRSPIGLDIGARSVEEIAVSIAVELVAVRAKIRGGADPLALFPENERFGPLSAGRSLKSVLPP